MTITKKIFLLIISVVFISNALLFGQSIQELQALQRLMTQNSSTSIQNQDILSNNGSSQTDLVTQSTLQIPKLNYQQRKGDWPSSEKYNKWLQETSGDVSVMELYGFVPDTSLQYFGYDIFTQRDSIAFLQNLPAPDSYILGPGDKIEISLWGEAQLNNLYTINQNGNIYIERVGLINLSGKTLIATRNLIGNKFKKNFATLRGKRPTSYISVTVNANKTINVHFVGEVNIPGIHIIHPFSSIVTGLMQSGGIKTTGGLRDIIIKRNDASVTKLDLYDYVLNGNLSNNIQLRENDVVVIPVRNSTIEIDGAIYRPGIYESRKEETISQLIDYTGGYKHNAAQKATIQRILPLNERSNKESIVKQFLFDLNQLSAIYAQDGDKIQIHSVAELSNEIEIMGQVKREGTYKYTKDMNLQELIQLAGGLEDSLFIQTMYLDEIEIIRKSEENEFNETIKINLQKHLDQNTLSNVQLKNNDLVVIRTNKNITSSNNVKIAGEINHPGIYALRDENESLQSIVNRAGGFTGRAFIDGIKVTRDTLGVIWNDLSVSLTADDSIFVAAKPGVVAITGEVYTPGLIEYKRGRSIKSYIGSAGGVTPEGNRRDIIVMYANGDIKPNGLFFHPKIKDGATIIINPKPPHEPFSMNAFLRDSASMVASLAMIFYVIDNSQNP